MTFSLLSFNGSSCYSPLQPILISSPTFSPPGDYFWFGSIPEQLLVSLPFMWTSGRNYEPQYTEIKAQPHYVSNNHFSFSPASLHFPSSFVKQTYARKGPGNNCHCSALIPPSTPACLHSVIQDHPIISYNIFLRKLPEIICRVKHWLNKQTYCTPGCHEWV